MKHLILILSLVSNLSFARVANDFYKMPFTGNVPTWGPITPLNLPVLNRAQSGNIIGSQAGSINAWSNLSGATVSLTTSGRPVEVAFETNNVTEETPPASNNLGGGFVGCNNASGGGANSCSISLNVNGTPSGTIAIRNTTSGNPSGNLIAVPCPGFKWVVTPPAGVNNFLIRWVGFYSSPTIFSTVSIVNCKLTATEL